MALSKPSKEINIVLLGQSGVGKSTFINASFNYLQYPHLEDLLTNELKVQLPAKIHVVDKNFDQRTVNIGKSDHNEVLDDAKSATQYVKAYTFTLPIGNRLYNIRLLDTPGMGDNRGADRDEINCEQILSYISQLKQINGFCIFLKPNSPRLDLFFNHCILKILSNLDSSAARNIFFVFTNARGENYKPGQTYKPLQLLLENIKKESGISIPLSQKNVFCFDNEGFTHAAAMSQGVELDEDVRRAVETSWNCASVELWRMLIYAVLLAPHDLKSTISINTAKTMAGNLTRPVTEIMQLLQDNLANLDNVKRELLKADLTKEKLIKEMNRTYLDIDVEEMEFPSTVCTHDKCIDIHYVCNHRKIHYKSRCCHGCSSAIIGPEVVGSYSLYSCGAFSWNASCNKCKHGLSVHKHIYYITTLREKSYYNESMATELNTQQGFIKIKQQFLEELETSQEEFTQEKRFILQGCAIIDEYLKVNSIISLGRPVENYFKRELQMLGRCEPGDATVEQLKRLQAEYDQYSSKVRGKPISAEEVEKLLKDLLGLKNFGKRIGQLYRIQAQGEHRTIRTQERPVAVPQHGWWGKVQDIVKVGLSIYQAARMFAGHVKL